MYENSMTPVEINELERYCVGKGLTSLDGAFTKESLEKISLEDAKKVIDRNVDAVRRGYKAAVKAGIL